MEIAESARQKSFGRLVSLLQAIYARLPLLVAALGISFLAAHFNLRLHLGDEGVTCMGAWRISQGEVPGADFFEIIPPFSFYPLAAAIKLLGPTVLASRLTGLAYGLLLLALMFKLCGAYLRHPLTKSLAIAVCIPYGVGVWCFPSHHWAVDICQLCSLYFMVLALDKRPFLLAFLAGLSAASGFFCLQDQGAYGILLLSISLLFIPGDARRQIAVGWLAGLAVTTAIALALLLPRASPYDLWYSWVVFPATRYQVIPGHIQGPLGGWQVVLDTVRTNIWSLAPVYLSTSLLNDIAVFSLPALTLLSIIMGVSKKGLATPKLIMLSSIALAFVGGAMHRWSIMNMIWAASAPWLLAIVPLDRALGSSWRIAKHLALAISTIMLASMCTFGILRIKLIKTATLYPVSSLSGTLRTFNKAEALELQGFLAAIETSIPAGEPVFSKGYIPLVNYLSGHPIATRYNIFVPYNTEEQARDWISSVEQGGVRYGFTSVYGPRDSDLIDLYIRSKFKMRWHNSEFCLWERQANAPAR